MLLGFPKREAVVGCELLDGRVHACLMGGVIIRCKFDTLEEGLDGGIVERRLVQGYLSVQPLGDIRVKNYARLFVPGEIKRLPRVFA